MPGIQRDSRAARQRLFYALAEPTRRDIIELLASNGQLSATEISDNFAVSAPAISQHLKVLREADCVRVEKRAQQRIYRINPEAMSQIEGWVQEMTKQWNARFNVLDKILEAEKRKLKKGEEERK
jgi:DNA-binding transcriptional ArsR family regulator